MLNLFFREHEFDKRQWENAQIYELYNVSGSYQNKSALAKSIQAEKRAGKYILTLIINIYFITVTILNHVFLFI